jgi:hypothetical protein
MMDMLADHLRGQLVKSGHASFDDMEGYVIAAGTLQPGLPAMRPFLFVAEKLNPEPRRIKNIRRHFR